jgi:hypothetical protein
MIKSSGKSWMVNGHKYTVVNLWGTECIKDGGISTSKRERERRALFHKVLRELVELGDVVDDDGRISPKRKTKDDGRDTADNSDDDGSRT